MANSKFFEPGFIPTIELPCVAHLYILFSSQHLWLYDLSLTT